MKIQGILEQKLDQGLDPTHLEVINESQAHNVPKGSESHFKVIVVSNDFVGKSLVQRHRRVYELVAEEMERDVHAMALHTYTEADWMAVAEHSPDSPDCLGGKAREAT